MASRRRGEDDGEEEGAVGADLEDDSLSEGSIISNGDDDADMEPSDMSEDEVVKAHHVEPGAVQPVSSLLSEGNLKESPAQLTDSKYGSCPDTKAMDNGLKLDDETDIPALKSDVAMGETGCSALELS